MNMDNKLREAFRACLLSKLQIILLDHPEPTIFNDQMLRDFFPFWDATHLNFETLDDSRSHAVFSARFIFRNQDTTHDVIIGIVKDFFEDRFQISLSEKSSKISSDDFPSTQRIYRTFRTESNYTFLIVKFFIFKETTLFSVRFIHPAGPEYPPV